MTFQDYQQQAILTVLSTGDDFKDLCHFVLGTVGEAGEIAEKFKKIIRDKKGLLNSEDKLEISKEIGDVLWYLAVLADHLGLSLEEIARANGQKLKSRQQRSVLEGHGDNR